MTTPTSHRTKPDATRTMPVRRGRLPPLVETDGAKATERPLTVPGLFGASKPVTVPGYVWKTAAVIVTYTVAAIAYFWPIWSQGASTHSLRGGDQIQTMWFLSWESYSLAHLANPFYATFGNAPQGVNLLVNTSQPLLGVVTSPITWLFGATASFNVLLTVALAGSATSVYFLARRYCRWRLAAAVAGLAFGFSPYEIGEAQGHLNLSFMVIPPLIFLLLDEITLRQRMRPRRAGAVLGILLAAQFFIGTEVFVTSCVMAGVALCALAITGRHQLRRRMPYVRRALTSAFVIAVVLLVGPASYALAGPGHINGPIQLPQAYRADLLGSVVPDALQWIAPHSLAHLAVHFSGNLSENGSYIGIPLLLVLIVCVWLLRKHAVVKVIASCGAVALILSLGANLTVSGTPRINSSGAARGVLPMPEALLQGIPLLNKALPARYSAYTALAAALLLGIVLDDLHQRIAVRRRAQASFVFPIVIGLVALLPLVPALPVGGVTPVTPFVPPSYFRSSYVREVPSASVAVLYPFPSSIQADAMLWQANTDMAFKMVGGYFLVPDPSSGVLSVSPYTLLGKDSLIGNTLAQLETAHPPPKKSGLRTEIWDQLKAWHVETLIAIPHEAPDPYVSARYLHWLMGRPPLHQADALVWHHVQSLPVPRSGA